MRFALLILCLLLLACSSAPSTESKSSRGKESSTAEAPAKATPAPASYDSDVPGKPQALKGATPVPRPTPTGLRAELVADGLALPANITWAPDGRLFFTEVSAGRVRIIEHGKLLPDPFVEVDEAVRKEDGLLGLTLAPDFAR